MRLRICTQRLIATLATGALCTALSACSSDDSAERIQQLEDQLDDLQDQVDTDTSDDNAALIAELEGQIADIAQQLEDLEATPGNTEELNALREDLEALTALLQDSDGNNIDVAEILGQINTITDAIRDLGGSLSNGPVLGSNATRGANQLPNEASAEDEQRVWRFAVFPDTQGRDDDNMQEASATNIRCDTGDPIVVTDGNGAASTIYEYVGVDFNGDGYYDAGTEEATDSKANTAKDADEDGVSYLVNVQNPLAPCLVVDSDGQPVIVAPEEREDYGPDWKVLPKPLVEAVADKMIELDVDLVLATGDITEYRAESDYVQWMDAVGQPLMDAGVLVFPVRGNHEVVNGRNWPRWFTAESRWGRQSVSNVLSNDINPYEGDSVANFDQGYKLYKAFIGDQIMKTHLDSGKVVGFPGHEDLVYYFIHKNTLFIGLDFYFSDLSSTAFGGTWLVLRDWLMEVIKENAPNVDHIVAYGHEPLSTKKRPQTYDNEDYAAYYQEMEKALKDLESKNADKLEKEQAAAEAMAAFQDTQAEYDDAGCNDDDSSDTCTDIAEQLIELEETSNAAATAAAEAATKADDALEIYEDYEAPSQSSHDMGQLGYLKLWDKTVPGLEADILNLFTEYKVTYIAGHDHQYARSLIHAKAADRDTTRGFTQIIGGSASWKSYENAFGAHKEQETLFYLDNFYNPAGGHAFMNSDASDPTATWASTHGGLSRGVSFVVVEINGRQITTKSYFASHGRVTDGAVYHMTESDMNLGTYYDYEKNAWCYKYSVDAAGSMTSLIGTEAGVDDGTEHDCSHVVAWETHDEFTRTTDATDRIVAPKEGYLAYTSAPEADGYVGSEASIVDGYNLTFDSSYASYRETTELFREHFALSWFADNNPTTVSDVLWISGNLNQDGTYFESDGTDTPPTVDVDTAAIARGKSESLTYINNESKIVNNPTYVTRDGVVHKGVFLHDWINKDASTHDDSGNQLVWVDRNIPPNAGDIGLDFADAMTLVFKAPEDTNVEDLTLARYIPETDTWEEVLDPECEIDSGYSHHYSVYYKISEQGPEGGGQAVDGCQQLYWSYLTESNSIWAFIHTDGRFALINKPIPAN